MTISYVQSFPPKWIIIGTDGLTAGGAQMFTYDSITRLPKPVYEDPDGNFAYPNPVIFDLNGTKGPIYWKLDSTDPTDLYYVEVFDTDGNLLWDAIEPATTGGGSDVTEFLSLTNYITNNQIINHIAPITTMNIINQVIAPSNHKGFTPALINPTIGTFGALGPDIRFVKTDTGQATDTISFPAFALGSTDLTLDVTPVEYIRYQSSGVMSGETYKAFQFPITQKVQNLSTQPMTFELWAKVGTTPVTIPIYIRQYFGSGTSAHGPSVLVTDIRTQIGSCALTTAWTAFNIQFSVPTVAGGSLGTPGLQTDDDAIYIQIEMPHNAAQDVWFIKPALYLGTVDPDIQFDSYDQIDSIDQTPRTGDIKTSYLTTAPQGWLPMNDSTIGNTGSGATFVGAYTYQLFKTIWDGITNPSGNLYAPVSGGLGASATADFLANKTMTLPLALGRALAVSGTGAGLTPRALGGTFGVESSNITLAAANIPQHVHTIATTITNITIGTSPFALPKIGGISPFPTDGGYSLAAVPLTTPPTAFNVPTVPPTTYTNVFIKL